MAIVIKDLDEYDLLPEKKSEIKKEHSEMLSNAQKSLEPFQTLVEDLKRQSNIYFWKKMGILIAMGIISVASILFNLNLATILTTLGLDGLGVSINFSEIKSIYQKKFKIVANLKAILNTFKIQIGKYHFVILKAISPIQSKIFAMFESIESLLEIKVSDSDFDKKIEGVLENLTKIANKKLSEFKNFII